MLATLYENLLASGATMTSTEGLPLHGRLIALRESALDYFRECISHIGPTLKSIFDPHHDFWNDLTDSLKEKSTNLDTELVGLAHLIGPTIRRSPLLTEADEREAGHAIKGMRAALRLRRFNYWETSLLHDEGIVLGVHKAGEDDDKLLPPEDAKIDFIKLSNSLGSRLALINPQESLAVEMPFVSPPRTIAAGYRPGTAFIMMWMANDKSELTDVYSTVKRCFKDFGIDAVRSDEIEHEGVITQRILDEIKTAEFLFADLSGERPSVYYEVGYAHAIPRRVVLYRKKGTNIHFDLLVHNCPEYENLTDLENKLRKRLEVLTNRTSTKKV